MLWKSFKYIIMNKNYFVSECSVAMTLLRRLDPERNLKTIRVCNVYTFCFTEEIRSDEDLYSERIKKVTHKQLIKE